MNLLATVSPLEDVKAEMLLVTVFQGEKELTGRLAWLDRILGGQIGRLLSTGEVRGQYKEFSTLHVTGIGAKRVLLIGLGKKEDLNLDKIRSVVAIAARNCRRIHAKSLAVDSFTTYGIDPRESAKAIAEGVVLGLYKFTKYMSEKTAEKYKDKIEELTIADSSSDNIEELRAGFSEGYTVACNTNFVRDLVNEPASYMTPEMFVETACQKMKDLNVTINILDENDILKEGMGAFYAVGRSANCAPPRMLEIAYEGNPNGPWVGLVGKGITFDSGGYNLKPSNFMERMHCDMGGAGAVLGAIKSVAELGLKVNCRAVMPLAENMVAGNSYKPGDIVKSLEGKTIEIISTDAEGRLLLADALTWIRKKGVEYLIDIATLTGAVVIALGNQLSGIMGTDSVLVNAIKESGEKCGERVWELPLYKEFAMQIKSDVADLQNSGGRGAGTITAGMFLKEFVGEAKWAHIDIAGTSTTNASIHQYIKNPYVPKEGATAVGVRLLYQFLADYAKSDSKLS